MAAFANRRAPLMPLAGLGIVLVAAVGAFLISHSMATGERAINRSIEVRVRLAELGRNVAKQNAGYRGYMLAAGDSEREEARIAAIAINREFARLEHQMIDPGQRADLKALEPLVGERTRVIERRIAEREHNGFTPQSDPEQRRQRALITQISAHVERMSAREQQLLEAGERQKQLLVQWLSGALAGAVLLVVLVAFLMVRDARQRFSALRAATRDTRLAYAAAAKEASGREEAEAQLRQAQKMESIGQLTGGIAHDFNNMLAVVVGSLDLARRRIDDPAKVGRHIADALEGAGRATTLVSRLLAFSRRQPLSPSSIETNAFMVELSELLQRVLGETILVTSELEPQVWPIFADKVQLENSLLNLALNARDAMEGGGALTLATANRTIEEGHRADLAAGDYVEIAVSDTGTGMDESVIARAFDPFFTTKAVGKGTGLGLSQVFGFVRQSGGQVVIESTVGEGTCIRLLLPRMPQVTETGAPDQQATSASATTQLHVLLVEDDDRVRRYSADALRELGHSTVAAANGTEALRLLETDPNVSVLFTDVVMPGISGPELAAKLRVMRPTIRILYTTGYARDDDNAAAPAALDAPVLRKPFSVEELDAKLREITIA